MQRFKIFTRTHGAMGFVCRLSMSAAMYIQCYCELLYKQIPLYSRAKAHKIRLIIHDSEIHLCALATLGRRAFTVPASSCGKHVAFTIHDSSSTCGSLSTFENSRSNIRVLIGYSMQKLWRSFSRFVLPGPVYCLTAMMLHRNA